MSALVAEARRLRPLVEEHADEGERERRLPAPTVEALTDAELLRMCVPAAYGGPEVDPMTLIDAIAAVAEADGGAGWCTMIAATTSSMAAFLPPATAKMIYGDPSVVTGGVAAPNGVGTRVERNGVAGFDVSGRWAWGSGTQHCQWILGGVRCDDDTYRFCFFPQADVEFHDTWYTGGMRGSGSLDYSVDDVFVADDFTTRPGVTKPCVDSPLTRFPNFTLLATGVAAVGLGVARRALDEVITLATEKTPQYARRTLAQQGYTQLEVAKAEAVLSAARAFLLDEVATAWDMACRGEHISSDQRVRIRLAGTHAARTAVEVADTAYTLAGGTAVYDTSVLGRCLRDAHVVTQHIQVAPKLDETLGKVLLGLDVDTSML